MRVGGASYRTIFARGDAVCIVDQTALPWEFALLDLHTVEEMAEAIRDMRIRGAPAIGAAAAWGVALGMRTDPSDAGVERACTLLRATRPTAVNLAWALDRMRDALASRTAVERADVAAELASRICDDDVDANRRLGEHALSVLRDLHRHAGFGPTTPLRVLTHCNAGWLATVDHGTATAGIYAAHDAGLPIHVWVDETRPRGQGARLTAWELGQHGVRHTVIPDTAAAHLMARGDVDVVIVGTDRTTACGDVVNKIGTRSVALAARDAGVPFWVAAPSSSIDFGVERGEEVEIEERDGGEVSGMVGRDDAGALHAVRVVAPGSPVRNWAFDVTPARLVTGIVTERGVSDASREGLARLFPERARRG